MESLKQSFESFHSGYSFRSQQLVPAERLSTFLDELQSAYCSVCHILPYNSDKLQSVHYLVVYRKIKD